MGISEYLLLAAATIFVAWLWLGKYKKNLPPGPRGYPFVGNILDLMEKPSQKFSNWAKQYGKIYTVKLGTQTGIVVSDHKLLKEMLMDSTYTGRPKIPLFDLFSGGHYGIINTVGTHWEEQRRWTLRKLRDYGFGKTSMEGMIMDEVNEVVDFFKKNGDIPIKISDRFGVAVMNSIWTILNGERLNQDDAKLREILDAFHSIIPVVTRSGLALAPWLRYIFPSTYEFVKKTADKVMDCAREAVGKHYDTYQDGTTRDFIDEYIQETKRTEDASSSFYKDVGRKNLEAVVSELIQAGSETTSNTVQWAIAYLSHDQRVQKNVHKELDELLGSSRRVTLSDKAELPYLEAVILETLRHSSLVSAGVQHASLAEKEILGYTIPKDVWIFANLYHIHHDPKVWGDDCDEFKPERFLSPDGKKVIKHDALIPFQIGRRQCLGESLARDTLFLFIATIFQEFSITCVDATKAEAEDAFFAIPKAHKYKLISRT